MSLLSRIKAQFTSQSYLSSSVRLLAGRDSQRQPFSYASAVQTYRSWVYAAANLNAIAVASQPLRLYVRRRHDRRKLFSSRQISPRTKAYLLGESSQVPSRFVSRKVAEFGDDFEVVTDSHPIIELLEKVNPYQNGYDSTVLRILYTELTGNAYLHPVIDKSTGVPVELWTMPSQWVEIVPGEQRLIDGYLYGASRESKRLFAPDEVIHFKRPNPNDLYYGIGKAEAAWGAIQSNEALHDMDWYFFSNKARPDWLLTVKSNVPPEELERLEVQIDEKLRGTKRTGRFLTMSADVDVKPLSFPPKDLAGRTDVVEEIAAVFGVPVSMLKANDPNLASASVGFASWRSNTILPLLRMDEEVLNQSLLPLFDVGDDAFLAYDNPVIADERFEFETLRTCVAQGIMTVNEVRIQRGLEPYADPNADRLLASNQPLGGQQTSDPGVAVSEDPSSLLGAGETTPAEPIGADVPTTQDAPAQAATTDQPVANTALNGAQISSLVNLATAAGNGELPIDSARAIAAAAFPSIDRNVIDGIFAPIVVKPVQPASGAAVGAKCASKGTCACGCGATQNAMHTLGAVDEKASDCVSEKISKLLDEGYDREQAIAIALSMCGESTKSIDDIDTKPPQSVADNARRALEVRESKPESQRGMTAVGLARARDLANRTSVSEETIRRMVAYFERHQSDKSGESWDEQGKGWQAWMGWGGDEGWSWAKRKRDEFDNARREKSVDVCEECGDDLPVEGKSLCMDCLVSTKDCGTGAGGFKPGNDCGRGGGGEGSSSVSRADRTSSSSVEVAKEQGSSSNIDDLEDAQILTPFEDDDEAIKSFEMWQLEGGSEFFKPSYAPSWDDIAGSGAAEDFIIDKARQMGVRIYSSRKIDNEPDEDKQEKMYRLNKKRMLEVVTKIREDMETATARSIMRTDRKLFRGMVLSDDAFEQMVSGKTISHKGVNSWTINAEVAGNFASGGSYGGVQTENKSRKEVILVLSGSRRGYVDMSDAAGEQEVLRPPSSLKIKKIEMTKNGAVVHVAEDRRFVKEDKEDADYGA